MSKWGRDRPAWGSQCDRPSLYTTPLREHLEESDVPYDVDVIDLTTASREFAHRVRREGVLWKAKTPVRLDTRASVS